MSHEDCGFIPGKVHGPPKCPSTCGDCDGDHHFMAESVDPDSHDDLETRLDAALSATDRAFGITKSFSRELQAAIDAGATEFFLCAHCDAWAEMVDGDDSDDGDDMVVCPGCLAVGAEPHAKDCIDAAIERERERADDDDGQRSLDFDREEP